MADTIKFGRWKLTSGSSVTYACYKPAFNFFYYEFFNNVQFDHTYTGSDALEWKGMKYYGLQYYICDNFAIHGISFNMAHALIKNLGRFKYNGKQYRFTMLPMYEWNYALRDLGIVIRFPAGGLVMANEKVNCNDFLSVKNNGTYAHASFISDVCVAVDTTQKAYYIPVLVEVVEHISPTISDSNKDLGVKIGPFAVSYTVDDQDEYDDLTVTESLNGKIINTQYHAVRNQTYTFNINQALFDTCSTTSTNTIKISVSDGIFTVTRTYTFTCDPYVNTPPTISGSNSNLGDKHTGFSISYTVDDPDVRDSLQISERLNGSEFRTIRCAARNTPYCCTVSDCMLKQLTLNSTNTLTIVASDMKQSTTRTYTFKRVSPPVINSGPTISDYDRDLGEVYQVFSINYYINDVDSKDTLTITEKLNNSTMHIHNNAVRNQTYVSTISSTMFDKLALNSTNTLTISVSDGKATTNRTYTFKKIAPPNNAPTISGSNIDLGDKYEAFSYSYSVNDVDANDTLTITELLNNSTIKTTSNAVRNKTYTCSISSASFDKLTLNTAHTLKIMVSDGKTSTVRTITFKKVEPPFVNTPPTISGYDRNLGQKYAAFTINYSVDDIDAKDSLTVTEIFNGSTIHVHSNAVRNQIYSCNISDTLFDKVPICSTNTITISVTDGTDTTVRVYTFTKANPPNNPPIIVGLDSNLGEKNKPFGVCYSVNDLDNNNTITVEERLNDITINKYYDVPLLTPRTFSISVSEFQKLKNDSTNTITVSAFDGKETTMKTITFIKKNNAPVIQYNGSTDLGVLTQIPTIQYSVSDADEHKVTITEKVNGKTVRYESGQCTSANTAMKNRTVVISTATWDACGPSNTVEIIAEDECGETDTKIIKFNRDIGDIEVVTKPVRAFVQPTKISLDIDWTTNNATGKVYVCNNALDDNPTWEDATDKINTKDMYLFTNKTKSHEYWAVSTRVLIIKDDGSTFENNIYNIKGTFE